MKTGQEKVESVAQVIEAHFEGKAVRLIRGSRFWRIVGVEFDEQLGCITLIVEGRRPILLWFNEKYVIAEVRESEPESSRGIRAMKFTDKFMAARDIGGGNEA